MKTPMWVATSLVAAAFAVAEEPGKSPSELRAKPQAAEEYRRRLMELRAERAAMVRDRHDAAQDVARVEAMPPAERAELQTKISELLTKLATAPPKPALVEPSKSVATALPADFKPADPISLSRVLFRNQEFEASLRILKLIETENLEREDRAFVQYLMASCLRHMGKHSEALVIYRDIADQREDLFLAECAVWQISSIKWQQEAQTQLEQSRRIR